MKKILYQSSPHPHRERRYPFLVAIDLLLHFGLTFATIILTTIALMMCIEAILPSWVHLPRF